MVWVLGAIVALVVGFGLYVCLAPSDHARWHGALGDTAPPDCTVRAGTGEARVSCLRNEGPAEALARHDGVAMATPRTTRLAGSPEEGRITWVTRSALWGFPDYTTAEARAEGQGARIDIHARLRFGCEDMGVNAARLTDWLARLEG